jgi:hypothetical protein
MGLPLESAKVDEITIDGGDSIVVHTNEGIQTIGFV